MSTEAFWSSLERAFADEDNSRFDTERSAKRFRLQQKLLIAGLSLTMLVAVGSIFYVYGIMLFNLTLE